MRIPPLSLQCCQRCERKASRSFPRLWLSGSLERVIIRQGDFCCINRRPSIAILLLDLLFLLTVTCCYPPSCESRLPLASACFFACYSATHPKGNLIGILPGTSTGSPMLSLCGGLSRVNPNSNFGRPAFLCLAFTHVRSRFSVQAHLVLLA